ncbi:MAG: hypothetical protein J5496_06520 [Lachnospiraceae bacterium]|nr:hypothetical protein [Lachnospiraceae bacterium]
MKKTTVITKAREPKRIIKHRTLLIFLLLICLFLASCTSEKSTEGTDQSSKSIGETITDSKSTEKTNHIMSSEETEQSSEVDASERNSDRDVLYYNRFNNVGEPPFSLPDAAEYSNWYFKFAYTGVSQEYYNSFLNELKTKGFSLYTMKFSDFLFRDDCMILPKYMEDDGGFSVSWYQKSPYAPQEGLSYEEAAAILMPENSLSKIPIHPIDITPEGFYERTGGQIFAVPEYSFDSFKSSGHSEGLINEDNERYSCRIFYVNGGDSYESSMEFVAVCDVDGDGSDDVLLLSAGPTSGLFTFDVMCVTNHGVYDTIFCTKFYYLRFFVNNGKIVVEGVGSDSVHHYFDILLEKYGEETIVMLYENGERLEVWGPLNSRNFTVLPETKESY